MRKRNKANLALAISIGGFLATFPVMDTGFVGGILHNGFLAASIGGLADWFAVTALFRKPLGISYRTDIIRRNRKRITEALVDYAADDLLSPENVMTVLEKEDTAAMAAAYLKERGGKERIIHTLDTALLEAVRTLDTKEAAHSLMPLIRQGLGGFSAETLVKQLTALMSEERYSTKLIEPVLYLAADMVRSSEIQEILLDSVRTIRERYEQDGSSRALIFQLADLTDERLRDMLVERIISYLSGLASHETDGYVYMKAGFETFLRRLSQSEELEDVLVAWKKRHIEKLELEQPVAQWLEDNLKQENPDWLAAVNGFVDKKLDEFTEDKRIQEKFDKAVKGWAFREMREHHGLVREMISDRLARFSDDDLVEFVEEKVEDDIQMIRINGSVVGSIVGMLLYAIVFIAEGGVF